MRMDQHAYDWCERRIDVGEADMPQHVPFPSFDALIDPSVLSSLLRRTVRSVATVAVEGADTSTDARFVSVAIDDEPTPSLFLKIVDSDRDWLAMITADDRHRAVTVWSEGVIDRMPPEVDAAVIACADWGDGYAVLMPNLHSELLAPGKPLTVRDFDALLDAMAAMHATFWGIPRSPPKRWGCVRRRHSCPTHRPRGLPSTDIG
ncbi:hypothetical protein [Agromyces mangrovi Wang et al. 2018]|uniref:hypothetical protein n=1 Tax=Agromyces mangrovi TaxID=1858653 RepID=UPI0025745B9E|nr:hypothetical protein [Agromyces mangrovi]BDZ64617.1 hypothetical protein GCM10025877_15550 [Agromyces mangrovi]